MVFASKFMSEVLECAPQARISPRRVLSRHAYNELTDIPSPSEVGLGSGSCCHRTWLR